MPPLACSWPRPLNAPCTERSATAGLKPRGRVCRPRWPPVWCEVRLKVPQHLVPGGGGGADGDKSVNCKMTRHLGAGKAQACCILLADGPGTLVGLGWMLLPDGDADEVRIPDLLPYNSGSPDWMGEAADRLTPRNVLAPYRYSRMGSLSSPARVFPQSIPPCARFASQPTSL